jgi:hypothetical protein
MQVTCKISCIDRFQRIVDSVDGGKFKVCTTQFGLRKCFWEFLIKFQNVRTFSAKLFYSNFLAAVPD